jgi:hypothetical protein
MCKLLNPKDTRETESLSLRQLSCSITVVAVLPDIPWARSDISDAEGRIYCEYDAPGAEAIREHARRAGLPVDHISEIALEDVRLHDLITNSGTARHRR